jgi:hypothetical protein
MELTPPLRIFTFHKPALYGTMLRTFRARGPRRPQGKVSNMKSDVPDPDFDLKGLELRRAPDNKQYRRTP